MYIRSICLYYSENQPVDVVMPLFIDTIIAWFEQGGLRGR
jgi:hypothetical protein